MKKEELLEDLKKYKSFIGRKFKRRKTKHTHTVFAAEIMSNGSDFIIIIFVRDRLKNTIFQGVPDLFNDEYEPL